MYKLAKGAVHKLEHMPSIDVDFLVK
jgi:hypothetical protein